MKTIRNILIRLLRVLSIIVCIPIMVIGTFIEGAIRIILAALVFPITYILFGVWYDTLNYIDDFYVNRLLNWILGLSWVDLMEK